MEITIFVAAALIIIVLGGVYTKKYLSERRMRHAEAILRSRLFPGGEEQEAEILSRIGRITKNRFTNEQMLDYYLKIKGLQVMDLHTGGLGGVRRYLMRPTLVRLNYMELVIFYDEFLSYPEAVGQNAKGQSYADGVEASEAASSDQSL